MKSLHLLVTMLLLALAACGPAQPGEGGPVVVVEGAERTETALLPRLKAGEMTPQALKGLAGGQVESALGAPSFRRREAGAQIWQYRVKACTLDLFLYEEGKGLVVAHHAVRAPQGGPAVAEQACLDAVLQRFEDKPVS